MSYFLEAPTVHSGCKNIGTSLFIGKVLLVVPQVLHFLLVVPQVLAKCKLLSFLGQGLLAAQSRDATRHHVGSLDDGDGDEAEEGVVRPANVLLPENLAHDL